MPFTTAARAEILHLSILDAEGNLDTDLEPPLDDDALLGLFRTMLLAREADQRALKLQRQGRLGTFPLCTGQEAAVCGPTLALRPSDWLVPAFRELGALLMRGIPLFRYLLYYNGFEEGNLVPEGNRTLPTSVPVASQTLLAVGLAMGTRLKGETDAATLVFFGDGATSEGDFHEALNFAGVWKAPVVFVCLNNQWAISMPRHKQTASGTLAQKAFAYGFPGIQVDGNDALAMYRATQDALARARVGEGPTLIEAVTYRIMQHTTSDDPRKYRSEAEEESWKPKDPLLRFRVYLRRKGLLTEASEQVLMDGILAEIDEAVTALGAWQEGRPDLGFDHVFAIPPPHVEAQRAAFLATLRKEKANA